eukprot:749211-Hanusia_phi.AAC.1
MSRGGTLKNGQSLVNEVGVVERKGELGGKPFSNKWHQQHPGQNDGPGWNNQSKPGSRSSRTPPWTRWKRSDSRSRWTRRQARTVALKGNYKCQPQRAAKSRITGTLQHKALMIRDREKDRPLTVLTEWRPEESIQSMARSIKVLPNQQAQGTIELSQQHFIQTVIDRFEAEVPSKRVKTVLPTDYVKSYHLEDELVKDVMYQAVLGSLLYVASATSRPDVCSATQLAESLLTSATEITYLGSSSSMSVPVRSCTIKGSIPLSQVPHESSSSSRILLLTNPPPPHEFSSSSSRSLFSAKHLLLTNLPPSPPPPFLHFLLNELSSSPTRSLRLVIPGEILGLSPGEETWEAFLHGDLKYSITLSSAFAFSLASPLTIPHIPPVRCSLIPRIPPVRCSLIPRIPPVRIPRIPRIPPVRIPRIPRIPPVGCSSCTHCTKIFSSSPPISDIPAIAGTSRHGFRLQPVARCDSKRHCERLDSATQNLCGMTEDVSAKPKVPNFAEVSSFLSAAGHLNTANDPAMLNDIESPTSPQEGPEKSPAAAEKVEKLSKMKVEVETWTTGMMLTMTEMMMEMMMMMMETIARM